MLDCRLGAAAHAGERLRWDLRHVRAARPPGSAGGQVTWLTDDARARAARARAHLLHAPCSTAGSLGFSCSHSYIGHRNREHDQVEAADVGERYR